MKWTRPPTCQHTAAYTCTLAQRCISSQLTKHDDDYMPGRGFFFFFPASALERSRGHVSLIHNRTVACFRLVLETVSILYERQRITTLYSFTAAEQWAMFQGSSEECLLKATCTHRIKKNDRRTLCALRLWPQIQFVTTNTICSPPSQILSWWWFEVCSIRPVHLL